MKIVLRLFRLVHALMAALFACAAVMLIVIASRIGWQAFLGELDSAAAQSIIEAVGLLAAAVVALQIAETITEEEVSALQTSARLPVFAASCPASLSW